MRIKLTVAVICLSSFVFVSLACGGEEKISTSKKEVQPNISYVEQQKELKEWLSDIQPAAGVVNEDSPNVTNYWEQKVVRRHRRAVNSQK